MGNLKWLLLIVVAGGLFRFVALDLRPAGFTWDEAALGYNAYALLKTGRDEHGQPLPLVLKSFGDYKPGLYAYLAVPSIAILGLNEFATRLPSALMGTLLIVIVYYLTVKTLSKRVAILTALVVAFNPWLIHFSRGAWEANISTVFATLGVTLFIARKYYLSAIFAGFTFLTYQSAKLFTPLVYVWAAITFKQNDFKKFFGPATVLLLLVLPIVLDFFGQSGRLKVFSVFSYVRRAEDVQQILIQDDVDSKNWIYYLFHSQELDSLRGILERFTSYFSARFLFVEGDWTNGRHSIPYYGYFHLLEVLPLFVGIYLLIKNPEKGKLWWGWIVVAVVPAALSRDLVNGVRALSLTIPLSILVGIGLSKMLTQKSLIIIYSLIWAASVFYMADLYFIHSPHFSGDDWLVAYKPAIDTVAHNLVDYDQVVMTNKLGQPYIFALFYMRVDPREFMSTVKRSDSPVGDVGEVHSFGKFTFRSLYWPDDRSQNSTIFVGDQYELPESDLVSTENLVRLGEIGYTGGITALKVVAKP